MSYKVSFNSGTGHDDLDEENEDGKFSEPSIYEFGTEAEREAFLLGVNITSEVMDGWVDAWVEVEKL